MLFAESERLVRSWGPTEENRGVNPVLKRGLCQIYYPSVQRKDKDEDATEEKQSWTRVVLVAGSVMMHLRWH